MLKRFWLYLVVVALSCAPAVGQAASIDYTRLFVFGDSLSDSGNAYAATANTIPAPPYQGRFSNGPVYAEHMAAQLGLESKPVLAGGTNYAFGGAGTDFSIPVIFGESPLSLQNQVNLFRARYLFGNADPHALYIVYGGNNNLLRGIDAAIANPAEAAAIRDSTAAKAANDIVGMVDLLHSAGAQHFLVPNAAPIGFTPAYAPVHDLANSFSADFNLRLASSVQSLNGPEVTLFDMFGLAQQVFADPLAYGLVDVVNPCLTNAQLYGGGGDICIAPGPNEHLFWDELHFTTAGHAVLANAMLSALQAPSDAPYPTPLPASIYLFGAAVTVLAAMARRRSL